MDFETPAQDPSTAAAAPRKRGRPSKADLAARALGTAPAVPDDPSGPFPEGSGLRPRDDLAGRPSQPGAQARLSIPLKPDGSADIQAAQASTRERLKRVIQDPLLAQELGLLPEGPPPEVFTADDIRLLYQALGQVETWITARFLKSVPPDIIAQVMPYTDVELDGIPGRFPGLLEPSVKVINKYVPQSMARWKDEVALFTIFVMVHKMKLEQCRTLATEREKAKDAAIASQDSARTEAVKKDNGSPAPPVDSLAPLDNDSLDDITQ